MKKKAQSSNSGAPDTDEEVKKRSLVRRYYPVFESTILFLLDYGKWWRAFRSYLKDELDYRSGLALQSIIYFVIGSSLLCFSLIWILAGVFFLIRLWTGSASIAAFSVGGIFFVLGLFFLYLMLKISRRIFDAKREAEDDWLNEDE